MLLWKESSIFASVRKGIIMKDKIITFGEIMLRLSKPSHNRLSQGRVFWGDYGGSEANVAVSLATLGDQVEYVTRVPDNAIGEAALMHLREFGLDTSHIVRGGERLGTYYFESAAAMRNSLVAYDRKDSSFYTLRHGDIDWKPIFEEAKIFHCSGITCAISQDALDTTMDAVKLADEMGVEVTCDINYRKNLWNYPGADAQKSLHKLMEYSGFIFGDQNEWEIASGLPHIPFEAMDADYDLDDEAYLRYFQELQVQFPQCKRMLMALRNQITTEHHTLSGILFSEGRLFKTRIYDIRPVLDPMGVGDAFVAAFIHAREKWQDDDQRCLDFALSASALKNTIPGDQNLVTEEEIIANIENGGSGRIER